MTKVSLATRTDVKTAPSVGLGLCDISVSDTVSGWKISAVAQPQIGAVTKDGFGGFNGVNCDVTASNSDVAGLDVSMYFDNVDLIPEKKWAPRVSAKKSFEAGDNKFTGEVTYAMKGNTSVLPKRAPLETDILKMSLKCPAVSGFTPKLEYGTLTKTAGCTLDGKVGDVSLTLKANYNLKKESLSHQVTASMKIPDTDVKATVELKDAKKGSLALAMDRYTLSMPISTDSAPDVKGTVLKVKYSKDFDM